MNGGIRVKEFNFKYRGDLELEGAEEHFLDKMSDLLSTNTKDVTTTSTVLDCYKNFTANMENGIELDCEISWNEGANQWDAYAWRMD